MLYHGSNDTFTELDPNKIGTTNGTGQGFGFYFSSDIEKAQAYGGNVYSTKLDDSFIELSDTKKTSEGVALFHRLVEVADMSDYYGMTLNDIIDGCENDAELMGELINSGAITKEQLIDNCNHYIKSVERHDELLIIGKLTITPIKTINPIAKIICDFAKSFADVEIRPCDVFTETNTHQGRKYISVLLDERTIGRKHNRLVGFLPSQSLINSVDINGVDRLAVFFNENHPLLVDK